MSVISLSTTRRKGRKATNSEDQCSLFDCGNIELVVELGAEPKPCRALQLVDLSVPSITQTITQRERRSNYRLTDDGNPSSRSIDRARTNLRAIQIMKAVEQDGRFATAEEQATLAQYVGWGGIPEAFDMAHADFSTFAHELQGALTQDEYASARSSTLTAFYTPVWLIDAIYTLAERLGIQGGRVIEPGMGTGRFLGRIPAAIADKCRWTGVEIDSLTGRIARLLYPDADIRLAAYEGVQLPQGGFDLCLANIPWGNYQVHDPNDSKCRWKIADYCIARTLDLLRPGGTMLVITGCATMDHPSITFRQYVQERANLIGAIRLPNKTFAATANTHTAADLIVLRKRDLGDSSGDSSIGAAWLDTMDIPVIDAKEEGETCRINEYFANHAEMILGRMTVTRGRYGKTATCVAKPKVDLATAIAALIPNFPDGVCRMSNMETICELRPDHTAGRGVSLSLGRDAYSMAPAVDAELVCDPSELKEGAYTVAKGAIMIYQGGELVPASTKRGHIGRMTGLILLRDAARAVLRVQRNDAEQSVIEAAQARLNRLYDDFTVRYGAINYTVKQVRSRRRPNLDPFRGDPDAALVSALECYDEESNTARKNPIFTTRVIAPHRSPINVDRVEDALSIALDVRGCVDLDYIAQLTGRSKDVLVQELAGVIYEDPDTERWLTAEVYLSGNVRTKLAKAERAAKTDPRFAANVQALQAMSPADIPPSEIDVALGAPWVPVTDVTEFIRVLLDYDDGIEVSHIAREAIWRVDATHVIRYSVAATSSWGTDRVNAVELIEAALNQQMVTVYDACADGSRIINNDATLAAREKQQTIKDRFGAWVWEDNIRAVRLARIYNDRFNNLVACTYNGTHLTLNGASPTFNWRAHQKDAIWRILQTGDALIGHAVGAGKTAVLCAAVMEERRLGLSQKPLVIVPSEVLGQFATDWLTLYPDARLLIATKEDFARANRRRFAARIATGDWDGILMAHSSFGKLALFRKFEERLIQEEVDELTDALAEARENGTRATVKELERLRKQYRKRLEDLANRAAKDDGVSFEELGVDRLFVDEADKYKNLMFTTKMSGVTSPASQRAWHLYLVTRYLHELHKGRAVVFATGTPISNSIAELWTMMRYIQPGYLRSVGLDHFDAWATQYGESITTLELAPDGNSYRLATRFARFRNLPELIQSWHLAADIRTEDMLDLPRPQIHGGKPMVIAAPPSLDQSRYIKALSQRADRVKSRAVPPDVDNMLAICNDGRRAALDMRLVDSLAQDYPDSKCNLAVAQIARIWRETVEERGAQLVFCDLSTPTGQAPFTVYHDIKTKLTRAGIPEREIAFIHDAGNDTARLRLFTEVRTGIKRVLIGSTEKCGAGVNVQTRLVAMHELDAPWRPRDVTQRSGRIVRQGNRYNTVQLYRYVTTGTFDTYIWQGLQRKQEFIGQVMRADLSVRRIEDVDSSALSYAEVKAIATGNPLIMEKSGIDIDIARLTRLRRTHGDEQFRLRTTLARIPEQIARFTRDIQKVTTDCAQRDATKEGVLTLDGVRYTERVSAGEALAERIVSTSAQWRSYLDRRRTVLGEYAGFTVQLGGQLLSPSPILTLVGAAEYESDDLPMGQLSATGLMQRLANLLRSMDSRLERLQKQLAEVEKQQIELERIIGMSFEHEDRLQQLLIKQRELESALQMGASDQQALASEAKDTEPDTSVSSSTSEEDEEGTDGEVLDEDAVVGTIRQNDMSDDTLYEAIPA